MDGLGLNGLGYEDEVDSAEIAEEVQESEELADSEYVADPRVLWGSEAARAMLVVLTRRLGPDFAREVSNELASRTFSYQAGCPDDRADGETMEYLLRDKFWDQLFAQKADAPSQ